MSTLDDATPDDAKLDDAKKFVREHDKQLDDALGKAGGGLPDTRPAEDHSDQAARGAEFADEHAGDNETATPESRDL